MSSSTVLCTEVKNHCCPSHNLDFTLLAVSFGADLYLTAIREYHNLSGGMAYQEVVDMYSEARAGLYLFPLYSPGTLL